VKVYYSDHYVIPLPEWHTFPIAKYALLRHRVAASGWVDPGDLREPPAATDEQLLRVHDRDYLRKLVEGTLSPAEQTRLGLPWSRELLERSRRSTGGTLAACRSALDEGIAANLAGGTHHAFRDRGEGYCVFNDAAVAARALQAEGLVRRIVILDADVHQGNGTAAIFADDPTVFTFSIHGARNYPLRKTSGDLDIALPDKADDATFLAAWDKGLTIALGRARADLAIYLAGADPYRDDRLGRLALTKAGLAERDRLVFERCRTLGLPLAITMAGGYARQINDTVDIQFETIRIAANG
jgi:acetoin utilization deacetylase AcuC-like enzyme